MTLRFASLAVLPLLLLSSCTKQGAAPATGGQHATVQLRDGTSVAGTVLSSSASEIQLAGDDKITRTIPMSSVRTVDYGETAVTPATPTTPADAPSPTVASNPAPAGTQAPAPVAESEAPPAPDPVHEQHYHPAEAAVTTKTYVIPVGTRLSVRTEETIDSGKASEGQTFAAELTRDVRDASRDIVIPRGANARIIIRSASKGGKIRGAADLALDLDSIAIDGKRYRLDTVDLVQKGRDGVGVNKRTGEFAGGGAAVGAIIGAIAGGGKGAAIGAGSGAGGGALAQILTKGGSVKVPAETVLTFQLERSLHVVASR